ncbi:unnamed protein product [Parnassius apollo]|uniref:(apollo) hypothetical protein n=1 Tax=Parnassius apollo TaxID=110799 RepID=A0A8S3Y412_PARAO|nr:unnamed protein product [Parnassius apollo]
MLVIQAKRSNPLRARNWVSSISLELLVFAYLKLANDVENQFTFPLFINFLVISILICFCVFCCVYVEKWNEINYKCFLTTALLQISLHCLYGQRLIDASESIAEAVYCSGWYTTPKKIKTSLIILLYRAQKGVCVTTYGFSIVCLSSYATVICLKLI